MIDIGTNLLKIPSPLFPCQVSVALPEQGKKCVAILLRNIEHLGSVA